MSTTLSGTVSSISKFLYQETLAFSLTASVNPTRDYEKSFASTDITNVYFGTFTVTTTPTTIDVTALTDPVYGGAINFATVKHVQIVNNDTTNALTAGGGTNSLFNAFPLLVGQPTGSCLNLTTNITVSGSQKVITLVASSGSISVDVFLVGN
jgi:hypothetical protein